MALAAPPAARTFVRDHSAPLPRVTPSFRHGFSATQLPCRPSPPSTGGLVGRCRWQQLHQQQAQSCHPCAAAASDEGPAPDCNAPPASPGRNILVAADSSEDSRYALQWAVQEVHRPGDVIHVVHCIPYLTVPAGIYAVPDGRLAMVNVDQMLANDEQLMLAEQQALQRMCAEVFQGQQVPHVVDILREDPLGAGDKGRIAESLCRKAEELQAAVVVIASQAKSGLSEFLLGSVAAHCTQHSSRPVLVLHAPKTQQPAGGAALLQKLASAAASALGGHPEAADSDAAMAAPPATTGSSCSLARNIVVAVDDSDASEQACSWAVQNLCRPGDTFHLLRIIPTLPYRAAYGGPVLDGMAFYADPPTEQFQKATESYVEHRFEPRLKEAGVQYQVDIIVETTDESVAGVGQAICRKADDLQAAAVVLGSHMQGGLMEFILGSVASYVAHHCRRPVAVLH